MLFIQTQARPIFVETRGMAMRQLPATAMPITCRFHFSLLKFSLPGGGLSIRRRKPVEACIPGQGAWRARLSWAFFIYYFKAS